jgi:hypothetical protein
MSSISNAYKFQIEKLTNQINKLILENKKIRNVLKKTYSRKFRNVLSEGPFWGEGSEGSWEDVIRDQSIPSPQNAPLAPINYNSYSNLLNRGETSPIPYSNLLNRQPGSENQGGSITSQQYTQYAYNAIMGIMQDAVDQGIIDSGSISQLAGQAFATWVAGGPSALANFLTQNNIPFQRD